MHPAIWAVTVLVLLSALVATAAVLIARKVVLPGRSRSLGVHEVTDTTVTLDETTATLLPGEYGLWLDDTGEHLRVGDIIPGNRSATDTVRRAVLEKTTVDQTEGGIAGTGRWTGHVYPGPSALDPNYEDLILTLPSGDGPAWLFGSSAIASRTWAIHLHGIRTTRITALRTVPVAQQLGYTSLVPSFRADGEGPQTRLNASMLGQDEWEDIEPAIQYAVDHGAEKIVLFGWSMGAEVAFQLIERSAHQHLVAALVLVAPVTDWRQTIRHGADQANLPRAAALLGEWALSSRLLSRGAGLPHPIDFETLDWQAPGRLSVPALVLHSTGDPVVPYGASERFTAANPNMATLVPFGGSEHAWEYNSDARRFNSEITDWVRRVGL